MLEMKEVTKCFGEKILFDNFDVVIHDGEFVVITGTSGCGKSTLLSMIGSLEKPTSGSITYNGEDIFKKKYQHKYLRNEVGFLFQNFALIEGKTVRENLNIIDKSARANCTISEALEYVGLQNELDTKVYKLSGGEQQRVALARLMIKKCSIVLADEPTGSLDKRNKILVMSYLHKLNQEGKTIIVVTHDEYIANMDFVDRIINI